MIVHTTLSGGHCRIVIFSAATSNATKFSLQLATTTFREPDIQVAPLVVEMTNFAQLILTTTVTSGAEKIAFAVALCFKVLFLVVPRLK